MIDAAVVTMNYSLTRDLPELPRLTAELPADQLLKVIACAQPSLSLSLQQARAIGAALSELMYRSAPDSPSHPVSFDRLSTAVFAASRQPLKHHLPYDPDFLQSLRTCLRLDLHQIADVLGIQPEQWALLEKGEGVMPPMLGLALAALAAGLPAATGKVS